MTGRAGQHWVRRPDGAWSHRPPAKVAVNAVLRWLQPRRADPLVVYSRCATEGDPPRVLGYGLGRVLHLDRQQAAGGPAATAGTPGHWRRRLAAAWTVQRRRCVRFCGMAAPAGGRDRP